MLEELFLKNNILLFILIRSSFKIRETPPFIPPRARGGKGGVAQYEQNLSQ